MERDNSHLSKSPLCCCCLCRRPLNFTADFTLDQRDWTTSVVERIHDRPNEHFVLESSWISIRGNVSVVTSQSACEAFQAVAEAAGSRFLFILQQLSESLWPVWELCGNLPAVLNVVPSLRRQFGLSTSCRVGGLIPSSVMPFNAVVVEWWTNQNELRQHQAHEAWCRSQFYSFCWGAAVDVYVANQWTRLIYDAWLFTCLHRFFLI